MKIALGTVQFGLKYGINNHSGIPTLEEINSIFRLAKAKGIKVLDTASAYGDAEEKIGILNLGDFEIVSKFLDPSKNKSIKIQLDEALSKLKINSIYGYLAHNADFLIHDCRLWEELVEEKANGFIQKIGYSLYTVEQLETLLSKEIIPDLVQLPYNLLDRKFDFFLPQLKQMGVEIHIRSVFLQGLYFYDVFNLPTKLLPLKKELEQIQQIANDFNESIGSLALNFVYQNPNIDKVVIGVDTLTQLENNIANVSNWKGGSEAICLINQIEVISSELLNPSNW